MNMRKSVKLIGSVAGVCIATASLAQVYEYVDENGNLVFTDKPLPNAKPVKLGTSNEMQSVKIPKPTTSNTLPVKEIDYALRIISPAQEQTFRDNGGRIAVEGSVAKNIKGTFSLLLDGSVVQTRSRPNFSLNNVLRGSHQIQIQLSDQSGKVLALSNAVTVFMHRTSILNRPAVTRGE